MKILFCVLLIIFSGVLEANAVEKNEIEKIKVMIHRARGAQRLGLKINIPVYVSGKQRLTGDFNFLIGYNKNILTCFDITPGSKTEDTDVYCLDQFSYDTLSISNLRSMGALRIKGRIGCDWAKDNMPQASELDSVMLFNIEFKVGGNRSYDMAYVPVQFLWADCMDNTFSYFDSKPEETSLAFINDLFEPIETTVGYWYIFEYVSLLNEDSLGIYVGAKELSSACIEHMEKNYGSISKSADFYNGGFQIEEYRDIDINGDVNLNGISFDEKDLPKFKDFMLYGWSAFTVNFEGQYAATELNNNGIPAEINDFQIMTRIMAKLRKLPRKYLPKWAELLKKEKKNKIHLAVNSKDSIGAYYLRFSNNHSVNEIKYEVKNSPMQMEYGHNGDTLNVLIYSFDLDAVFPAKKAYKLLEISYDGPTPELISATASGYYGEEVNLYLSKE